MKKEKPTKFISENDAEAIYENRIKDLSCSRCVTRHSTNYCFNYYSLSSIQKMGRWDSILINMIKIGKYDKSIAY